MNALTTIAPALGALVTQAEELDAVRDYTLAEKSPATRAAYAADMKAFVLWCRDRGVCPLPALSGVVAQHLAAVARAGLAPSSVARRVAAIAYAHALAGHEPPTRDKQVAAVVAGIRRSAICAPKRKAAATTELVAGMLATCGTDMKGRRDRALLALGFAGAFRRSELVALRVDDLEEVADGYRVTIRRSKTDQTGQGQIIPVGRGSRLRPVEAVQDWLQAAGIAAGPAFLQVHRYGAVRPSGLTGAMVALIVKRRALAAGLDPKEFSGHSLRAGFVTSATEAGKNHFKIMDVTRHKSMDTLRGYVRSRDLFRDYAGDGIL
jgi:site-specific recombinase XerD